MQNIEYDPKSEVGEVVDDLIALQTMLSTAGARFARMKDRLIRMVGEEQGVKIMADAFGYLIQKQEFNVTAYKKVVDQIARAGNADPATIKQAVQDNTRKSTRTVMRKSTPQKNLTARQKRNLVQQVLSGRKTIKEASIDYGITYRKAWGFVDAAKKGQTA